MPAAPAWRSRITGTGSEAPDQLLANPANYRVRPKAQREALAGVLDEVGWVQNVVVNQRTGHVVDGHLRVALAISRSEPSVPVLFVDLSEDEERLVLASLDPLAAMATTDEAVTKPGDLWLLGEHRLLCGDAGSEADLDRLLDGVTVDLFLTDPRYNVKVEPRSNNAIAAGMAAGYDSSYQAALASSSRKRGTKTLDAQGLHHSGFDLARGKSGIRHHQKLDLERHPEKAQATHRKLRAKDRPLVNDFISDEAFEALLLAWFSNAARVMRPGGSFYVWGGYANLGNYPLALKAAGLYFSQAIIWDKEHPVLTRKDFMRAHEWSLYGWKEGAAHRFFGPPNATDLWHVKKVSPNAMVHLTEKPVELARRAIEYRAGDRTGGMRPSTQEGSMSNLIDRLRPQIEALCRTYRVRQLDVFGSAIREDFDSDRSDVDFLVEFEPDPDLNTFHAYMDLRRDLSRLLDRPVDLVMPSAVRDRYFAREIAASREPVYGA